MALYAPVIFRRHMVWMFSSARVVLAAVGLALGFWLHTWNPCAIVGRTTAVYNSLDLFMDGPHVDAAIRVRAL